MKLTFYGATEEVTGSNYLLESSPQTNLPNGGVLIGSKSTRILIDCGLHQGSRFCEKQNFEPFPYDPKSIDAVIATHAHMDHIGRIPKLYKDGFRGQVISTFPTVDFAEHLLLDSEHILAKEAAERNQPPIYALGDINEVLKLWRGIKYHQKVRIGDFEIELFDAGHVLGSSFVVVSSNDGKRVVFSGDLGNMPAPIVKDTEHIDRAEYAVIESTYGGHIHKTVKPRKEELEDVIEETIKAKGVLMIPAFAMERTQELLYEMNLLVEQGRIPRVPVFIDSPLAIKLTAVYKKYSQDPEYFDKEALELLNKGDAIFNFPGLVHTLTTEESKSINEVPAPKIIIAGAGMSNGGRILHHEQRYLSDPKSTILFIGYQAVGSLGRQILDGMQTVRIMGEDVAVRCKIKAIGAYSAHADQPLLLEWLRPMEKSLKKVFLVHGEPKESAPLVQRIRDQLAVEAMIPTFGEEVML